MSRSKVRLTSKAKDRNIRTTVDGIIVDLGSLKYQFYSSSEYKDKAVDKAYKDIDDIIRDLVNLP